MKVLVADDDADLRTLIGFTLSQAGFEVCSAGDGVNALETFAREAPTCVLLDVNMPQLNGVEVCRRIRQESHVPIMMLTVRDGEDDLVAALDAGADDYVRKPFSPRALLARVRALARRTRPIDERMLEAGNLRLDRDRLTLQVGAGPLLRLTPLELKALHLLMTHPGRTVPAERLLTQIWGSSTSRERRTLKQLVYRLRQKLERDPAAPQVLQTTPGAGYRLCVE